MGGEISLVLSETVLAVNTTGITDMSDTLIVLIVALIPIMFILAIWAKLRGTF